MAQVESDTLKVFQGQNIGRVPFWEVWFGMRELAARLAGNREGLDAEIHVARQMGWDALTAGWVDINCPSAASGTLPDGTTRYVPGGATEWEDFESRPLPDFETSRRILTSRVKEVHEEGFAAVAYLPWSFHQIATAMGWENFALKIYDDMPALRRIFDWADERIRTAVRDVIIPARPDFVLFDGDCAYKTGLMVHPDMFRRLTYEGTQRAVHLLREEGILYTFHSDGKVDGFMPMLVELGFAGVHGIEAQANDLADIKHRFGDKITLIGNMDVVFLAHATVQQVHDATREMLETGCRGGRYIAACNTSPLDYIPDENYLAMAEEIRAFRF